MNQLWWIPASVGGLCLLAVMTEVFIFARRRFARCPDPAMTSKGQAMFNRVMSRWVEADVRRHPEQHEHVPGEWQ